MTAITHEESQFLIGTVLHREATKKHLGEVLREIVSIPYRYGITFIPVVDDKKVWNEKVSIPYRYGITYSLRIDKFTLDIEFQFLIGTVLLKRNTLAKITRVITVSIPYRYGITTVFSPFSGSVFFFLPLITLKSLSTSLFIIANILEKSSFFQKFIFSSR